MITNKSRKNKAKMFILVLLVMFTLASVISIYTEISRRKIELSNNQITYRGHNSSTNEFIFVDEDKNELLFMGDYNSDRASKSMKYKGSLYQMRVSADMQYVLYIDNNLIEVFAPVVIEGENLKEINEDAYMLIEAFGVIEMVERNVIVKILLIQFMLVLIAAGMFVDPGYFWTIGYFKRNNGKKASNTALSIIKIESIVIASIVVCFPLIRLIF